MANVSPNTFLQDLGAGDVRALALVEYSGMVLRAFPQQTAFLQNGLRKQIASGKSHQFPATWKMTTDEHTAGTELSGNPEPISEERTVPVDTKQLVSHNYLDEVTSFITHFDERSASAFEASQTIAETLDTRIARQLIIGSRIAARGPASEFPEGVQVTRTGATEAAAYPISVTGSYAFQDDLAAVAQVFDETNVPKGNRVAYIRPRMKRVLLKDKTIVSRDFVDPSTNQLLQRIITQVEGFRIVDTNQVPSTNITTGEAAYQGDFSKVVACCSGHPTSTGTVMFGGIRPIAPTWIDDKLSWLIGARLLQGTKWLRPEACAEITFVG